jgi:hypothetical protein
VSTAAGLRFAVDAGRGYLAVSPTALLKPRVEKPFPSRLKDEQNRADYLVVGPRPFSTRPCRSSIYAAARGFRAAR